MPNMPNPEDVAAMFPGARVVAGPPRAAASSAPADDPYALPDFRGGAVEADGRVRGDDLVGLVLVLRPLGTVEVETQYGEKLATDTYVVESLAVGTEQSQFAPYIDHGRLPILWKHVRSALGKTNTEAPWIIGTIVKRQTAYFLNPCTPEEQKQARHSLRCFVDDRQAGQAEAEAGR